MSEQPPPQRSDDQRSDDQRSDDQHWDDQHRDDRHWDDQAPGRPGQGWAPAPLSEGGRASFAPHSTPDATPAAGRRGDAIDRYAPGRSIVPVLVAIVAIVAAGAIVYTTTRPQPVPAASATPSHSATPKETPRAGKRFSADRSRASGTWQVTHSRWTSAGLDAYVEITLDSGSLTPSFDAMPNSGSGYVPADTSTLTPQFDDSAIEPGTTRGGWLFFATTRETTLIFLGDANDPQISGIEVAS